MNFLKGLFNRGPRKPSEQQQATAPASPSRMPSAIPASAPTSKPEPTTRTPAISSSVIPPSHTEQFRTTFGLTHTNGSVQFKGNNQSAPELNTSKQCAQILQLVRLRQAFSQLCVVPTRPVSVVLNTSPPSQIVTGLIFINEESVAELTAELIHAFGMRDETATIVGGFVILTLPTIPKAGEPSTVENKVAAPTSTRSPRSIHDATTAGDLEAIQALLQEKPNLALAKAFEGMTPLHQAARANRAAAAELLLATGADVNAKNDYGLTPLHYADAGGLAELLLGSKADVNATTYNGETSLHLAACDNDTQKAKLLLANGAEINARRDKGWTPLYEAAIRGRREAVELLLDSGAEVDIPDNRGVTPLMAAQGNGYKDVVAAILAKRN